MTDHVASRLHCTFPFSWHWFSIPGRQSNFLVTEVLCWQIAVTWHALSCIHLVLARSQSQPTRYSRDPTLLVTTTDIVANSGDNQISNSVRSQAAPQWQLLTQRCQYCNNDWGNTAKNCRPVLQCTATSTRMERQHIPCQSHLQWCKHYVIHVLPNQCHLTRQYIHDFNQRTYGLSVIVALHTSCHTTQQNEQMISRHSKQLNWAVVGAL